MAPPSIHPLPLNAQMNGTVFTIPTASNGKMASEAFGHLPLSEEPLKRSGLPTETGFKEQLHQVIIIYMIVMSKPYTACHHVYIVHSVF